MTKKNDIAIIAIRLVSLYSIYGAVVALPGVLTYLSTLPASESIGRASMISMFVSNGTILLGGICFWILAPRIAKVVCRGTVEDTSEIKEMNPIVLQIIAVSILGLFILADAIPSLVTIIISYVFPKANPRYVATLEAGGKLSAQIPITDYIQLILHVGFGFWFLLGSQGIVTAVRNIWEKGKQM